MSGPRISVIVPNREMGRFLPETFRSIEAQLPAAHEVLLVDAGSGDESLRVAQEWRERGFPVDVEVVPGANPSQARNAGLKRASGDFVTFLDADDLFPRWKFAAQLARFERAPWVDVVSGRITLFQDLDPVALAPADGTRSQTVTGVSAAACLIRREVFDRVGGFDETLLYSEDTDFILRLLEARVPMTVLWEEVLYYRRHEASLMSQPDPRRKRDFHRALAKSIKRRAALGIRGDLPRMEDLLEPPSGEVMLP